MSIPCLSRDNLPEHKDLLDAAEMSRRMRHWLSSDLIRSGSGAYCAWRDVRNERNAFEYPEITGYALTFLAGCSCLTPNELEAGRKAARWLIARLEAQDRSARDGWDGGAVYTFDLGMIATGLIRFGAVAGDDAALDRGVTTARELEKLVRSPEGLKAIDPAGPPSRGRSGWSTDGVAHLFKCVQCLLLADEVDDSIDYVGAARALLDRTLAYQQDDGRFQTEEADGVTMLHPHLYTIEGLYMWGTAQGDDDALERGRRALNWAWSHQLDNGGFPRHVVVGGGGGGAAAERPPEQNDLGAQILRMARALEVRPSGYRAGVRRLLDSVRVAQDGTAAAIYQPASGHEHHNAWVTMFAAQALDLAQDGSHLSWRDLV